MSLYILKKHKEMVSVYLAYHNLKKIQKNQNELKQLVTGWMNFKANEYDDEDEYWLDCMQERKKRK